MLVHGILEILESAIFQGFRPEGWYIKERMTGVEPASKAWEAFVLPMNYIRRQPLTQSQEDSVPHAVTQHYLR